MVSLLTVPLDVIKAAVHVKDFMNNQHFFARRTLDRSCDKVATKVVEFNNHFYLQCDGHKGIVAAGHHRTQPDAAESLSDAILLKSLQISPDVARAFAPAAELRADIEETTPPACLMVYHENMVHFVRSVPTYVPAALNGGISGKVIMRPLHELTRSHAVFGGPMTHHMNRHGVRVRKHTPRRGTSSKG